MAIMMSQAATMMFGAGALQVLGDELKMRGLKNPVIITDKGVTGAGVTAKVEAVIKEAGLACSVWDGCLSDAPVGSVEEAAAAARDAGADSVVGLGGGSSMDSAKAVSLIIINKRPVTEFMFQPPDPTKPAAPPPPPGAPEVPVFLIPTTSGTGSEVTQVAVLSEPGTSKKVGARITGATLAIVDPLLTLGVPPHLTAMTGMDVVAHAVEAITGVMRNPMSDLRGFEALRLVSLHLYNAVKDGTDIAAREGMSFASSLAGMAFNNSITSLAHAISQALAPSTHLHHGLICGLATPTQLELYAEAIPQRVRMIGEIFGAAIPYDATAAEIGKITADKIRSFMSLIGIKSLEQMGFTRKEITDQTDALMDEGMKDFSPCPVTREVAFKALDGMCDYKGA